MTRRLHIRRSKDGYIEKEPYGSGGVYQEYKTVIDVEGNFGVLLHRRLFPWYVPDEELEIVIKKIKDTYGTL